MPTLPDAWTQNKFVLLEVPVTLNISVAVSDLFAFSWTNKISLVLPLESPYNFTTGAEVFPLEWYAIRAGVFQVDSLISSLSYLNIVLNQTGCLYHTYLPLYKDFLLLILIHNLN